MPSRLLSRILRCDDERQVLYAHEDLLDRSGKSHSLWPLDW